MILQGSKQVAAFETTNVASTVEFGQSVNVFEDGSPNDSRRYQTPHYFYLNLLKITLTKKIWHECNLAIREMYLSFRGKQIFEF